MAKIRFADKVPDTECEKCPYAYCSHPFQQILGEYKAYSKLCIKDLSKHDREKVLNKPWNENCVHQ